MSIRLYVGNLPKEFERQELQDFFADAGESMSVKVITDRKTGKCRGFGFVTVKNDAEADQFIEKYNGNSFKESSLKIEKAQPRTKSKSGKPEEESAPTSKPNRRNNSGGNRSRSHSESYESTSAQPDPRWAADLEKLKQMLAAQTTNS